MNDIKRMSLELFISARDLVADCRTHIPIQERLIATVEYIDDKYYEGLDIEDIILDKLFFQIKAKIKENKEKI